MLQLTQSHEIPSKFINIKLHKSYFPSTNKVKIQNQRIRKIIRHINKLPSNKKTSERSELDEKWELEYFNHMPFLKRYKKSHLSPNLLNLMTENTSTGQLISYPPPE